VEDKKAELKTAILADLRSIYNRQLTKARETAFGIFRSKLIQVSVGPNVEAEVDVCIRETDTFFCEKAKAMLVAGSNWRFDNERRELNAEIRESADTRLKVARVQGTYAPNARLPISLSFHYLNPKPFGFGPSKDGMGPQDQVTFDKKKDAPAVGFGRFRPFATGPKVELPVDNSVSTSSPAFSVFQK